MQVIIDTDPGLDDAVAILYALSRPAFQVLGLTTVAGNIGLETVTRNAGRILALMGRADIPVRAGAAAPLTRAPLSELRIHGADGLGGVAFPEPQGRPGNDATGWMAATLDAAPAASIDLLALGPLTNLARLCADHPRAARRLRRVIAMGGAVDEPGNIGQRAEFNLSADPEAARAVFGFGLPLTLVPLDVTRRVRATREDLARLRASGTPAAVAAADLIGAYFAATEGRESRPLHDPCVMLFAEMPELFGVETRSLAVATEDDPGALSPGDLELRVAMRVDGAAALDRLIAGLAEDTHS